jgi:GrpB-like predicted nucleotidyltransferase (UPF0157 family)
MLGLKRGAVQLVPYCNQWPLLFAEEECAIRAAIGHIVLDVQHIGSTAVPGLAAKPILDIGIAVRDAADVERCITPLAALGYQFLGDRRGVGDWFFAKGSDDARSHYLHMVEHTSSAWSDYLSFRDTLTTDERSRDDYASLKRQLLAASGGDRSAYTEGKEEFIRRLTGRRR